MMRLVLLLLALLLTPPFLSSALADDDGMLADPAIAQWAPQIQQAAQRFNVPQRWICEVIRQESRGHAFSAGGRPTVSWAGAMGLMQVMPGTYAILRTRYGLGANPYDPANNIMAGTAYIREMYDRFGAPGFLAAYNAGPERLASYMANGGHLPRETVAYLAHVAPRLRGEAMDMAADASELMPPNLIDAVLHSGGLGPGWQAIRNTEDPSTHGRVEFAAPLLISASRVTNAMTPAAQAIRQMTEANVDSAIRHAAGAAYAAHAWVTQDDQTIGNRTSAIADAAVQSEHGAVHDRETPAPTTLVTPDSFPQQSDSGAVRVHTIAYQAPLINADTTFGASPEQPVPLSADLGHASGDWIVSVGSFIDPSLTPAAFYKLSAAIGKPFGRLQKVTRSVHKDGVLFYQADVIGLTVTDATMLCDAMIRRNLDCSLLPPGSLAQVASAD